MPTDCEEQELVALVRALCDQNGINLVMVGNRKLLGEWAGQCKVDRFGFSRKIVGCSVAVIINWGEDSESMRYLLGQFEKPE